MKTLIKNYLKACFAVLFLLLSSHLISSSINNPEIKNGFRLIEKRFIKETNCDCYLFEHIESGAKLLKIANDDPNKMFSVTFHTIPNSDCGEAHIIEHSVLNGSKKYPVKSPLDIAIKGSLKTYINASTYKDRTSYPVSSLNEKDYFNLMGIYLDATFNPLIYSDKRIFMQEGWHYELTDANLPVQYRGVVYGEMKGAFSNPFRYLSYYIYKHLFPDTGYGFDSGGVPSAIPLLTYEKFLDFHKKYYNPSNSYFVLYGDANIDKELKYIDEVLKECPKGKRYMVDNQKPFSEMKDISEYYPVMEGSNTKNQAILSLNYVYDYGNDLVKTRALNLLSNYLFNREASPIKIALHKAGIGSNVSASSIAYKQNVMHIIAMNSNAAEKQNFYNIIIAELKKIVENGLNKEEMESILNRYEFEQREENSSNRGISYLTNNVLPYFIYENNPFAGLEYEKIIKELRAGINTDYYEKLINETMINNPHSLLLSIEPKPGLDREIAETEKRELDEYKKKLSGTDIEELIKENNELIAYQQSVDSPEALATIPGISVADIDKKANYYGFEEHQIGKTPVIHRIDNTNGILYTNLFFDLRVLPQDQIQYAALLSNLLGLMNTENYSYGKLDTEFNNHTGGVLFYLNRYFEEYDDNRVIPKFIVSFKYLEPKTERIFRLISEILSKTNFGDSERLKILLTRHFSNLDVSMKREGSNIVQSRFVSYFTNGGKFQELTGGYDYLTFVSALVNNFDAKREEIISTLSEVASKLFTKENMIVGTTCSKELFNSMSSKLNLLTDNLNSDLLKYNNWSLNPVVKNEGFKTSSKVQFICYGFDFKKLGYQWSGKMNVLNRVISQNWLNQQIRIIGGAYGGFSVISPVGIISMISYRDPNLKESIDNFRESANFLKNLEIDQKELNQFIIGSISSLDLPKSPQNRGETAFINYFNRLNSDFYQKERDQVLSITIEDLKNYSGLIQSIIDQNVLCIYGNAQKIEQNSNLFKSIIEIK